MAISSVSAHEFSLYTNDLQLLAMLPDSITVTSSPVALAKARNAAESECLAEVLYYEARGEGIDGEKAVAEVVLQRTQNPDYPETVCGVVYDGAQPDRHDCQFSFACDGSLRKPKDLAAWNRMQALAEKIMSGTMRLSGVTARATAYHSVDVTPGWADTMIRTVQIGNHVFYKRNPLAPARGVQVAASPIESLSGFFTPPVPGLSAAVASEKIQPQIQTADAVGDGS